MNHPYPRGAARAIAESRANGLKPADTLLIVLAGSFDWPNPQIYADPQKTYRWDWLRGLYAVVLIDSTTSLGNTLQDIDRAEPSQLDVIDFESRKGWLVLFTRPRIRAIRWPSTWVSDWLSTGELHRALNDAKKICAHQSQVEKQTLKKIPEAVWN